MFSLESQHKLSHITMRFIQAIYGQRPVIITAVMIQIYFRWVWSAFYDKTHTDVFGSLSCAPFIATFLFFNKTCRNNQKFSAVLWYVPNLTYGYGKSTSKKAVDKLKDEHKCLRLITDQIEKLNNSEDFKHKFLGKR